MKRQPLSKNNDLFNDIYNILLTKQKLNDNCIMQLLYIYIDDIKEDSNIDIIDSQVIKMFMLEDTHLHYESGKKILATYFNKKNNIIIIPLNHADHWSVIIYISTYYQWYHFDSLLIDIDKNYHHDFIVQFLKKLKIQNIFNFDGEKHKILHINTIKQENNWECGQYLLMYARLIIKFPFNENYDIDKLDKYIDDNIININEKKRKLFIKEMLNLIKNILK